MGKVREYLDRFILSDHKWKKKYCPNLYCAITNPKEFFNKVKNNPPNFTASIIGLKEKADK